MHRTFFGTDGSLLPINGVSGDDWQWIAQCKVEPRARARASGPRKEERSEERALYNLSTELRLEHHDLPSLQRRKWIRGGGAESAGTNIVSHCYVVVEIVEAGLREPKKDESTRLQGTANGAHSTTIAIMVGIS